MIQLQHQQQKQQGISMPVALIMTQGRHAGTSAPIHPGYYLVGRHKQCQIRPKSRSVSRRHCLLLRNDDGFGALDLKSTGGTYVNGQRLKPHRWRTLGDGDQIRFGKVEFSVSIEEPAFAVATNQTTSDVEGNHSPNDAREAPESFDNFDVSEFLDAEDEIDLDEPHPAKPHDTFIGEIPDDEEAESEKILEVNPAPKKRPPRRKIDHNEYKRGSKRSISLPSFGGGFGDGMNWKLVATIVMASAAIGLFIYQSYRLQSGPQIEVRQNLD